MKFSKTEKLGIDKKTVIGVDIGSTTSKIVVFKGGEAVLSCYERHMAQVREKTLELIKRAGEYLSPDEEVYVSISGSAGLGLAEAADLPFVQEVYATGEIIKRMEPDANCVIELGGEDAKVIFFDGGTDERMNGTCAGGTGAFIDQMATLLNMTPEEMDEASMKARRIYPIASRCGVFAKSDIQPLLNQGAGREDLSASIYRAVVNQTIAGLAQGRRIKGKVIFLGGPLYYCRGLGAQFKEVLNLDDQHAIFPDYAPVSVALGAASLAAGSGKKLKYSELLSRIENAVSVKGGSSVTDALFESEEEYKKFTERHARANVYTINPADYKGRAFLGIDSGSTTTKLVLITESGEILYSFYSGNKADPVELIRGQLEKIYSLCKDNIEIAGCATTGYGEELIKHAFHADDGLVETMAHFRAARHFNPDVDFILDIGGQDIKCFKVKNNAIDSIMLNEACSSGCGSFIETFARSMGYSPAEFAEMAIRARRPVELGSRCTVFMNSSVKQAQKDGAEVGDIAAGLSISVVKNALYKVIRCTSADEIGKNIVVQGGTFLNNAVLRAFEREVGREVIRPNIAGLMGAYGAALFAKERAKKRAGGSSLITPEELAGFTHTSKSATCHGCGNNCRLTVNTFSDGEKFISGNMCERGLGGQRSSEYLPNLYEYKREYIEKLNDADKSEEGYRGTIGLPLALGMYDLLPFWYGLFSTLGYRVVHTGMSTHELYATGQYSIPSDTACYPAKLMHGHIEKLTGMGVRNIFYPCLTYNFSEDDSADNHYNCPVVAYYSELLSGNMETLQDINFLFPYLNIRNRKQLAKELCGYFGEKLDKFSYKEMKKAVGVAFRYYNRFRESVTAQGAASVRQARKEGKRILILAGRPYHVDLEICHGIDRLANSLGFAVISEDAISAWAEGGPVNVLNQWTFHSRMYRAARYAARHPDVFLVQLVSFGCGIDAITSDEIRDIVEEGGNLYTQIKIDEVTNLGAVKIRLRSLLGAIEEKENG